MKKGYFGCLILLLLGLEIGSASAMARAEGTGAGPVPAAEALIVHGGYGVEKNNRLIAASNLHTFFVPASILKIATALAALEILGPEFRFATRFYWDEHHDLFIQGFGDPFLISEEVAAIVRKLKLLGCTEINNIYLDDSAFSLDEAADGTGASDNPYDAQNSALAVNFNTVNVRIDKDGRVASAEEQTPTLGLMAELAEGLTPGVHRINISREEKGGAEAISRYTGELFRALQQQEKIAGAGAISRRRSPANLEPLYTHFSSRDLQDVIGPLLLYSNNFIANQIFLILGARQDGYPATWQKSRRVMADYLRKRYGITGLDIIIVEGAGLSRHNRVTPWAMLLLLDAFKPYASLLPREDGRFLKSGTLEGVYSYAGYFAASDRLDSFVLLLNQVQNNRDRVLDMLEQAHNFQ